MVEYKVCDKCDLETNKYAVIEVPSVHDFRARNYTLCDMCLRKLHFFLERDY